MWLLLLALLSPARASPSFVGEKLTWAVRYLGVVGGWAWAEVKPGKDGAVQVVCGAKNADWYARFYTIDDRVESTWVPGVGSRRYVAHFREGRFHQDEDMHLDATGFSVQRHQEFDAGWKTWTTVYPAVPGAQDPVSAIYEIRRGVDDGDGPWTWPVFSGKETWPFVVSVTGREVLDDTPIGPVPTRIYKLRTAHRGMLEQKGRFLLWLTDDDRRIPVRMVVRTNFGSIRADLVEYRAPWRR